ncbi:MAG: stage II sporulation protein P [Clostridia bacterium]|nr:stage II sporulation protein P [Clostridia bacterium]
MNKRKRQQRGIKLALRVTAAGAVALLLLALPVNWIALGQQLGLTVAGLQQPQTAVSLLGDRLTAEGTSSAPAMTPPSAEDIPTPGGETYPDLNVQTAAPLPAPSVSMISPPGEKGNGGKVVTQTMDTGDTRKNGIATLNRSGTSVDIRAALNRTLSVKWTDTDAPQVLILHTHTTEGYMQYDAGYYNEGDRNRTEDHSRNVCAAGEAIRLVLEQAGITAIHDTTVHDSPIYSGAYTRSAATAETYLKQYPSIRVVLDIHRDAILQGDTTLVKPTAVVNGRKAAQMMLITGVVSTGALPHPEWEQNLTFSTHLQQALGKLSPDLMRPLNTVASRYNQHLSTGWVLVEVGSEGNTVEEAVYAGQLLGQTLADLLA